MLVLCEIVHVLQNTKTEARSAPVRQGLSFSSSHVTRSLGEGYSALVQHLRGNLRYESLSRIPHGPLQHIAFSPQTQDCCLRVTKWLQQPLEAIVCKGTSACSWFDSQTTQSDHQGPFSAIQFTNSEQNDKGPASQSLPSSQGRQVMK